MIAVNRWKDANSVLISRCTTVTDRDWAALRATVRNPADRLSRVDERGPRVVDGCRDKHDSEPSVHRENLPVVEAADCPTLIS